MDPSVAPLGLRKPLGSAGECLGRKEQKRSVDRRRAKIT